MQEMQITDESAHDGAGGSGDQSMNKPNPPSLRADQRYAKSLWDKAERLGVLTFMTDSQKRNFRSYILRPDPYPDQVRALHAMVLMREPSTPPPFLRIRSEEEGHGFWLLRLMLATDPSTYRMLVQGLEDALEKQIARLKGMNSVAQNLPIDNISVNAITGLEASDHGWFTEWARAVGGVLRGR